MNAAKVEATDTIYQRMKAGEYIREELTPDGLHPNDKGHKLVAEEIEKFLESVKAELEVEEKEPVFPKAMTENAYENAKRLTIREISPKLCGFHADMEEKTRVFVGQQRVPLVQRRRAGTDALQLLHMLLHFIGGQFLDMLFLEQPLQFLQQGDVFGVLRIESVLHFPMGLIQRIPEGIGNYHFILGHPLENELNLVHGQVQHGGHILGIVKGVLGVDQSDTVLHFIG